MPIQGTDILWKYSTKDGSAGNQNAQPDPNQSLGKYISTSPWAGGVLHDLFDRVTGDENAASAVDYRCVFVHNNHASLTLVNPIVWMSAEVAGGANAAIGVDPTAASAIGSGPAQAASAANETTAPAGVAFSSPTTKAAGILLGDLAPGQCRAIWVRRSAANTGALANDGVTLQVEGDTL